MGFFSKLFGSIDTNYSPEVKSIYNQGVIALSEGNLPQAIHYFQQVEDEHPSAAYNLGLIYLDGAGVLLPNYDKARQYFQLADELGHQKAQQSANIIGFDDELFYSLIPNPQNKEVQESMIYSMIQFFEGGQCGNLAYVLGNIFILWNEKFTTYSHPNVLVDKEIFRNLITEFITYEVYCIREYANAEVRAFYNISSLPNFDGDWETFYPLNMFIKHRSEAELSTYFNNNAVPILLASAKQFHKKNLQLEDLGVLRLMMVNYVYTHCLKTYGKDFFDIHEDNDDDDDEKLPF